MRLVDVDGQPIEPELPQPALSRRRFLTGASAFSSLLLAGCQSETFVPPNVRKSFVGIGDVLNMSTHRLLLARQPLAREYEWRDISKDFPIPGTSNPENETYQRLRHGNFADWRLPVTGLVNRPVSLSLEDLKRIPARSQITCHLCEMGWSAIAQWTGAPLSRVLDAAGGLKPEARYVLFECFDYWYDSIDLFDVFHPQTILAYGMNGKELPVGHGAPLRLRVERHCGWKSTKYLKSIRVVASLDGFGMGKGAYWADRGWLWYGGV
jgi:DMSO/TMAO reductase YedYZ molybdopterin-dependent catalytic subunit